MNCGVYTLTAPSGGQYVGSSCNIRRRGYEHFRTLRLGQHKNGILQSAWEKYGEEIVFKTVLVCEPKDLLLYEQIAIDGLSPRYNLSPTAGNTLGKRHSQATKDKISAHHKGTKLPPRSVDYRKNISDRNSKRVWTLESRAKLSAAKTNPSAETRAKMSAIHKGKVISAGHRAILSNLNKNRPPEIRAKLSETSRGERNCKAKLTDESVKAMRKEFSGGVHFAELANKYGVSRATANKIVRHKLWKHVGDF